MTHLSLLLSAALLLIAPNAGAQSYDTGSQMTGEPRSSVQIDGDDRIDFPDLTPAQIAADVTTQFNVRTGEKEFVAPTFDPFEDNDALAATVSLRSMDAALDLNGDPVVDGALLDVSLFYADAGDRRFGLTRDALFLNGELVPMILRDSRELECSARVTERVYQYDRYDDRNVSRHIWIRPTYRGHRGFSYGSYGAGWGGYGTIRPRFRSRPGSRHHANPRGNPRANPRVRSRPQSRPDTQTPYYPHVDPRVDGGGVIRPRPRSRPRPERRETDSPTTTLTPDVWQPPSSRATPQGDRRRTGTTWTDTPRPDRTRSNIGRADPAVRRSVPRSEPRVVTPRAEPRPTPRSEPRPRPEARSEPRATPRAEPRAQPRPEPRSQPRPQPRSRPTPTPKRREAPNSRPIPRSNPSEQSRVVHDMFPGDGYGDAIVVSSQRDCAREDQLTLFIPNDRLEAARFDGLTLILRDVTYDPSSGQTTVYDERPLYIPPNYIEGFRVVMSRP